MQRTLFDVPDEKVDEVIRDFESEGARVTRRRQDDGKWTVVAEWEEPPGAPPGTPGVVPPPSRSLVFGSLVSAEFRSRVLQLSRDLGVDADDLMAVMAFETGEQFAPDVTNAASGAVGLIQFMPSTATGLGTSVESLKAMTALEQLDVVERYFEPHRGRMSDVADLYMAVLWPRAIGIPNDSVLWERGSREYELNSGLDANGDGRVTKAEAAAKIVAKLGRGRLLLA